MRKPVSSRTGLFAVLLFVLGAALGALVTRVVYSPIVFTFEVIVPNEGPTAAVPHKGQIESRCFYGDWRKELSCIT